MFMCEVKGDTRKEVVIETYKAIRKGRAKLHIMELQDDEERTKKFKETL